MKHASAEVIQRTQEWVEKAIIGLDLCPFAEAAQASQAIRYVVSDATDEDSLLVDLLHELEILYDADPDRIATTLLMHPFVLSDFDDAVEFLQSAFAAISEMDLICEVQLCNFHPDSLRPACGPGDIENACERSPYPTLHLLRESSVNQAVSGHADAGAISARNVERLRALGHAGWRNLWRNEP